MAIDINIPSQVKTYANLAAFPATGSLKTIFIAEDTNKTYRWTGSTYVEVSGADLSGYVPTSRTLTINGTTQDLSADRTFTISTGITIGTTAITSGTVGRVLFEGTGNVVQDSANLFWDNTNGRLGIGTSSPSFGLDVNGTARVQNDLTITKNVNGVTAVTASNTTSASGAQSIFSAITNGGTINIGKVSNVYTPYKIISINDGFIYNATGGDISILNDVTVGRIKFAAGSASTAQMSIFSTGNVGINTTTDAGYKLDVNGTARFSGTNYQVVLQTTSNGIIKAQGGYQNTDGSYTADGNLFLKAGIGGSGNLYITPNNGNTTAFGLFANGTGFNIGLGLSTVASASFQINSTTQGFLPPRLTTTQKNAIASPATGLVVFDSTLNKLCVRGASAWETITSL